jgi:hypothetical protein
MKRTIVGRSVKYLIVNLVNVAILTTLLALWTDVLELNLHQFVRPVEFLKILAFSFLSLVCVGCYSFYLRKKGVKRVATRIKGAIILTALTSSYLYITYTERVISNVIINGRFREQLAAKIKPSVGLANGTKAAGLSNREYHTVAALTGLPPLSPTAGNIAYQYEFDGFLPDYFLMLTYEVPRETGVVAYDHSKGNWSCTQSVSVIGDVERITYTEALQ